MVDPLSYPWEKFSMALFSLAREGPLQSRLHGAYMSFHPLRAQDFNDPGLRDRYQEIMRRLTAVKNSEKGHVPATLEKMSDEEAGEVANLILDITFAIASARLEAARQKSN